MADTDKLIKDILDREKRLRGARSTWETHWQELAEVALPRRADFMIARTDGAKRTERQFDSVPMLAVRQLASSIDWLIKSKWRKWFFGKAVDAALNDLDEVKAWFAEVEKRMWTAIYDNRARFQQSTGEVDLDLVVFGTAVLFTGESRRLDHLVFRSVHLRDALIAENADGEIDTLYRTKKVTARQAEQQWGLEALGAKTKEALRDNKEQDKEFTFIQAVQPREERNVRGRASVDMPFLSAVIDVASEHLVAEGGFHEFPYQVPRWDTSTDEVYGRSPAMLALPDINMAHEIAKTLIKAGQKAVDPSLLIASDSLVEGPKLHPGGITYFDAQEAKLLGRIPIQPLVSGADIPLGREMQNDVRDQIWMAMLRPFLQLPTGGPQMTATEILERKAEFIRVAGVFSRLEPDYTGKVVPRVFNIMDRAESFPPRPEVLEGKPIRWEYESPVGQAQKRLETAAAARSAEILAPYTAFDPTIMDNFDGDQIGRDVGEGAGMPNRWIRPKDQVDQIRQDRAEQAQAAQQAEAAERLVEAGTKIAKVLPAA